MVRGGPINPANRLRPFAKPALSWALVSLCPQSALSLDKTQAICYTITKCNTNRRINHMPRSHESQEKIPAWKKLLASGLATAALTGCAPGVSASNSPENTSGGPAASAPETVTPTTEITPPVELIPDSGKYSFPTDEKIEYYNSPFGDTLTPNNAPRRYVDPKTGKETLMSRSDFFEHLLVPAVLDKRGEFAAADALKQLMEKYNDNVLNAGTGKMMYDMTNAGKTPNWNNDHDTVDQNQPLIIWSEPNPEMGQIAGSAAGYEAWVSEEARGAMTIGGYGTTDAEVNDPSLVNMFKLMPAAVAKNSDFIINHGDDKGYRYEMSVSDIKTNLNTNVALVTVWATLHWESKYDQSSPAGKAFAANLKAQGKPTVDKGSQRITIYLRTGKALNGGNYTVASNVAGFANIEGLASDDFYIPTVSS